MNYTSIIKQYNEVGLACLPTKENKNPLLSTGWKNGFTPDNFIECYGVGVICGEISGGLECLDFDNHQKDARKNLANYLAIPEVKEVCEKHKLPIEASVSGGFHLLFRCSKNEGNRKLASRLFNGSPDCFVETRGEGGYFCAAPTTGYSVVYNDILIINKISEAERAVLIDHAISMNEYFPSIKTEYEQTDRPGDTYNEESSSIEEMKSILKGVGWTDLGNYKWRRPSKKEGISATLGKVAPNVFYCFSSNCYPFEPNKAYTPFQILGLIKFNGDFKEAAKSIAQEKTHTHEVKGKLNVTEIEKILLGARIDTRKQIEKPPTILSIRESHVSLNYNRLFTLGNFSCIIGKAKSKKTFFLSLITASLLKSESDDMLRGDMPTNKNAILYFDTEQSEYDSYNVMKRIERMVGVNPRLRGYNLRPFTPMERCQIIEYAFKLFGDQTGYCVIDGIADLANGINDEEEATRVSSMMLRLSKVHNCHISTILHQNKNDNFATGHLGSSIMKKAEIIISVSKRDDDTSEVNCDMSRGIGFKPFEMTVTQDGIPEVVEYSTNKPKKTLPNYLDKEPMPYSKYATEDQY